MLSVLFVLYTDIYIYIYIYICMYLKNVCISLYVCIITEVCTIKRSLFQGSSVAWE